MKKISILILFFFLLQCIIFIPSISVSATEETSYIDNTMFIGLNFEKMQIIYNIINNPENTYNSYIYHYDNFMESYFDNLTINHGSNIAGSCGYVGIDMLLSYYDTFLSDDIVPEAYDKISDGDCYDVIHRRNSPGSLFDEPIDFLETYNNRNQMTSYEIKNLNDQYYYYMYQLQNISLHAKLITIGSSLGVYDSYEFYPAGTNHNVVKQIIEEYMSMMLDYSKGNQYQIYDIERNDNIGSEDVRNFVINKIRDGYPVLVSVRDEDGGGHWVIAYDYDEITNEIYCNFGWGGNATHLTPENYVEEIGYTGDKLKNFTVYDTALTIEFNIPHKHSNNYAVTRTVDGQEVTNYYCYDSSEIEVYNLDFDISYPNPNTHKITYECGDISIDAHKYGTFHICLEDNSKHVRECIVCGKEKKSNHILNCTFINSSMHNMKCSSCEYDENSSHSFTYIEITEATHKIKCSACKYEIDIYHTFEYIYTDESTHTTTCTICGHTKVENHYFNYRSISANYHILTCVYCGATTDIQEAHSWKVASNPQYVECQYCGHLKLKPMLGGGEIIPVQPFKEDELEEETE